MGGLFLLLIDVINAEERTGERGDLSKTDKERLVDLSLRVDKDSTKEHYQSTDREDGGGSQLGNIFGCFIHKRFSLCGPLEAIRIAYIPFRSNSPPARRIFAYPFAKIRLREGYILIVT